MTENSIPVAILLNNENIPKDIFLSSIDEYFGPQLEDFKKSSLSVCVLSEQTGLNPCKMNAATFVKSQWLYQTSFAPDQIFEFKIVICENQSWKIILSESLTADRLIETFKVAEEQAIVVHLEWNKPHTVSIESFAELYSMDESLIKSHYENPEVTESFKNLETITEDNNDDESLLDSLQESLHQKSCEDQNYNDDTDDSLEPGKEAIAKNINLSYSLGDELENNPQGNNTNVLTFEELVDLSKDNQTPSVSDNLQFEESCKIEKKSQDTTKFAARKSILLSNVQSIFGVKSDLNKLKIHETNKVDFYKQNNLEINADVAQYESDDKAVVKISTENQGSQDRSALNETKNSCHFETPSDNNEMNYENLTDVKPESFEINPNTSYMISDNNEYNEIDTEFSEDTKLMKEHLMYSDENLNHNTNDGKQDAETTNNFSDYKLFDSDVNLQNVHQNINNTQYQNIVERDEINKFNDNEKFRNENLEKLETMITDKTANIQQECLSSENINEESNKSTDIQLSEELKMNDLNKEEEHYLSKEAEMMKPTLICNTTEILDLSQVNSDDNKNNITVRKLEENDIQLEEICQNDRKEIILNDFKIYANTDISEEDIAGDNNMINMNDTVQIYEEFNIDRLSENERKSSQNIVTSCDLKGDYNNKVEFKNVESYLIKDPESNSEEVKIIEDINNQWSYVEIDNDDENKVKKNEIYKAEQKSTLNLLVDRFSDLDFNISNNELIVEEIQLEIPNQIKATVNIHEVPITLLASCVSMSTNQNSDSECISVINEIEQYVLQKAPVTNNPEEQQVNYNLFTKVKSDEHFDGSLIENVNEIYQNQDITDIKQSNFNHEESENTQNLNNGESTQLIFPLTLSNNDNVQPCVSNIIGKFEALNKVEEINTKVTNNKDKDQNRVSSIIQKFEDSNIKKAYAEENKSPDITQRLEDSSKNIENECKILKTEENLTKFENNIKGNLESTLNQKAGKEIQMKNDKILKHILLKENIQISPENSNSLRINDDYKYPDSVTPTKVEHSLSRLKEYDVMYMDDDVFVKDLNERKEIKECQSSHQILQQVNNNNSLNLATESLIKNTPKASIETLQDSEIERIKMSIDHNVPVRKKKGIMKLCGCVGNRKKN